MTWLRTLMLLALIVWLGSIVFFAFVLAPTLFSVLPSTRLAGNVVNATLSKLHWMGLVSGVIFLISSLGYNWQRHVQLRPFMAGHIFVAVMLTFTVISQFRITPRMRELRAQLEMVQRPDYTPYIPGSVPGLITSYSQQFDRLHAWSTRLEGGVLFLGLGVVILTARRFDRAHS
jgi:uncharacterized membrane protein